MSRQEIRDKVAEWYFNRLHYGEGWDIQMSVIKDLYTQWAEDLLRETGIDKLVEDGK